MEWAFLILAVIAVLTLLGIGQSLYNIAQVLTAMKAEADAVYEAEIADRAARN